MIDSSGSAFPVLHVDSDGHEVKVSYTSGLTKREWFASVALQGLLANPRLHLTVGDIVYAALDFADAMIEESKK